MSTLEEEDILENSREILGGNFVGAGQYYDSVWVEGRNYLVSGNNEILIYGFWGFNYAKREWAVCA